MKNISKFLLMILILSAVNIFAQKHIDITSQLNKIAAGNYSAALADFQKLNVDNPKDPSVLYLDAVLTRDGKLAAAKYKSVYEKYPKSKYADASLYKVYSFYFAQGFYRTADDLLVKLKKDYPESKYIQIAEMKTPEIEVAEVKSVSSENKNDKNTSYFTIQAGAFLDISNAENLKTAFNDGGYNSDIKQKTVGGSTLNVVYVGKFKTEGEAATELTQIKNNYNLEGRVVKL